MISELVKSRVEKFNQLGNERQLLKKEEKEINEKRKRTVEC